MTTLNKIVDTDKADVALYDKVNAMAQALNDGKAEDNVVVKTVNGKTPDDSGDVIVSSGGILPGMIIQTLATSSYVPEGCVPCDGQEYPKSQYADFFDDWLVGGLLKTCTYEEYNAQIATYGQCGMIALDTTNNKFKVPTIKDGAVIEQCGSDNVGQAYKESLPNIKGSGYLVDLTQKSGTSQNAALAISGGLGSGAFWVTGIGTGPSYDASTSSSVYQDGAKVQTDNVRMRYFIVLATGSINQSQFDWAQYQSSLALKASKDLSDITTVGKATAVGWCVPDYTAGVAISGITAANTSFTVPKDGILYIKMSSVSFLGSVFIDDMVACSLANASGYNGISVSFMPIGKGAHTFRSENVAATASIIFYPYKGA